MLLGIQANHTVRAHFDEGFVGGRHRFSLKFSQVLHSCCLIFCGYELIGLSGSGGVLLRFLAVASVWRAFVSICFDC